ncbi:hypothetical protein K493DRAFT_360119 [Basidiobolus meristosporus CBS 931.73]|uniref:C3H1-type domain-containing protein n=1 Tax=Basidiobolus meristosporus CBS 931.73 TaxID=1314790 RepID=A0A1Y1XLI5_9FUNG|nr:hypothetical protein K493DRAFT_360119 [Basidiobolus meristosporus CBS 931.73]|eukprot:ORX86563.1 hypothetical protein K493DRAFT_360119 [Basidiobolus meristosporus CBS 931.73]
MNEYPANQQYYWSGGYEQYEQSNVAQNNWAQPQTSFQKDFQYQKHVKTHQTCKECGFAACKPVLLTHKEVVHGIKKPNSKGDLGYKPLAISLDTPEEIAKWIEQRKKRYPTDENIRQKQLEEQNKRERGEPVATKNKRPNQVDKQPRKKAKSEDAEQTNDPLNLIADYGNSDEGESSNEDMDPEKDAISSKTNPTSTNSKSTRKCKYFLRGKCRHGDKCKFQHIKPEPKKPQDKQTNSFRKRPGLLKMLLNSEIEREQSYILQALRFIVQQNFFVSESGEESYSDTDSSEE